MKCAKSGHKCGEILVRNKVPLAAMLVFQQSPNQGPECS
jgi:hypothetical protein